MVFPITSVNELQFLWDDSVYLTLLCNNKGKYCKF